MRKKIKWSTLELDGRPWVLIATELGICRIVMPNETLEDWSSWIDPDCPGSRAGRKMNKP